MTERAESPSPKPPHPSPEVARALQQYWRANVKIMVVLLVVWAAVGLGCGVLFVDALNEVHLGGYPLGFWFAQQGSILTFVVLILIYALAINRLDRAHHEALAALGQTREDASTRGGEA